MVLECIIFCSCFGKAVYKEVFLNDKDLAIAKEISSARSSSRSWKLNSMQKRDVVVLRDSHGFSFSVIKKWLEERHGVEVSVQSLSQSYSLWRERYFSQEVEESVKGSKKTVYRTGKQEEKRDLPLPSADNASLKKTAVFEESTPPSNKFEHIRQLESELKTYTDQDDSDLSYKDRERIFKIKKQIKELSK